MQHTDEVSYTYGERVEVVSSTDDDGVARQVGVGADVPRVTDGSVGERDLEVRNVRGGSGIAAADGGDLLAFLDGGSGGRDGGEREGKE